MKRLAYILLFMLIPWPGKAQAYHPLCSRDSGDYGKYITRTLSLLATSTAARPNDVNIIVYGQSVSKQIWWKYLEEKLGEKFPFAHINMVNKSVGGFASQKLWKTTAFDILPCNPDLVIFHVFGSHYDYEKILRMIRSETTAEMLVWNDPWAGPDNWADTMSYYLIPGFCEKYKLEFANIRSRWIAYLSEHKLKSSDLRHDGVHLNEQGNRVLADMLLPYFNYVPEREADPFHLVDTLTPAKIPEKGSLTLRFTGNRVDLSLQKFTGDTVKARVLIDNYPPSSLKEIYYITRPNADSTKDWPWQTGAVIHTTNLSPLVPEKWTVQMTELDDSLEWFRFKLYGSITGYDGSGISNETFISNSGRVIIEPGDWFVKEAWDMFKVGFHPGYTISWYVKARYSDYIDNSVKQDFVLVQGIRNSPHYLQIIPYNHKSVPVEKIIIYKPFLISE